MINLETQRLVFRQWQRKDFPIFKEYFADAMLARFVGGTKTPEESWRLMASYIGHYELLGFSYLALQEKSSQQLIGTVGLWNSEPWPEPELGYWLLPGFQGKGFAFEAGLAVKEFALHHLKLNSLVSYIDADNGSSISLAQKLGAKFDATIQLLDFGPHEVYRYW